MCQPSGRSIPVGGGLSKTGQARQRLRVSGQPHGNHGSDTNEAMVWHTSQGNAGPNQCQTNKSHRCLWLGHQGGSSSSMQRRQRDPLKPSGILMLYSHRQHHLHCAQRHLVHMIVNGVCLSDEKKTSPSSNNAPEAARKLRARAAAASWLVPMQIWTQSCLSAKWLQVRMRRQATCPARG